MQLQMKNFNFGFNLDKIGISASVLCAIHCAFLPALVTMLPLLEVEFLANKWIESFMIIASILIAGTSLGISYKHHRKRLPMALFSIGLILIVITHLILPEIMEVFIMPIGGLTVATAHYFNWNFSGKCPIGHSNIAAVHKSK